MMTTSDTANTSLPVPSPGLYKTVRSEELAESIAFRTWRTSWLATVGPLGARDATTVVWADGANVCLSRFDSHGTHTTAYLEANTGPASRIVSIQSADQSFVAACFSTHLKIWSASAESGWVHQPVRQTALEKPIAVVGMTPVLWRWIDGRAVLTVACHSCVKQYGFDRIGSEQHQMRLISEIDLKQSIVEKRPMRASGFNTVQTSVDCCCWGPGPGMELYLTSPETLTVITYPNLIGVAPGQNRTTPLIRTVPRTSAGPVRAMGYFPVATADAPTVGARLYIITENIDSVYVASRSEADIHAVETFISDHSSLSEPNAHEIPFLKIGSLTTPSITSTLRIPDILSSPQRQPVTSSRLTIVELENLQTPIDVDQSTTRAAVQVIHEMEVPILMPDLVLFDPRTHILHIANNSVPRILLILIDPARAAAHNIGTIDLQSSESTLGLALTGNSCTNRIPDAATLLVLTAKHERKSLFGLGSTTKQGPGKLTWYQWDPAPPSAPQEGSDNRTTITAEKPHPHTEPTFDGVNIDTLVIPDLSRQDPVEISTRCSELAVEPVIPDAFRLYALNRTQSGRPLIQNLDRPLASNPIPTAHPTSAKSISPPSISPWYIISDDPARLETVSPLKTFINHSLTVLERSSHLDPAPFVQIRCKTNPAWNRIIAKGLPAKHRHRLLLNVSNVEELEIQTTICRDLGLAGVHLAGNVLVALSEDPGMSQRTLGHTSPSSNLSRLIVGVSCHSAHDLLLAKAIGATFAVLSPVLPSTTCPSNKTLSWAGFKKIIAISRSQQVTPHLSVYALGGVNAADLQTAYASGGVGIAAIKSFWHDMDFPPPVTSVVASENGASELERETAIGQGSAGNELLSLLRSIDARLARIEDRQTSIDARMERLERDLTH
ncbi:hypothetical protein DFJ77DRAFT_474459 [Powellomyces hirtus]|nr:hypothetical protein DFJ77DRAFT_474459 [Powellomyces hirtus]